MKNFIEKLLKRIDSIFKNGGDNWSSQRIMSVGLVYIPLIIWAIISLASWALMPIPESVLVIIIAGLTGKIAGKIAESKDKESDAK